MIKRPSDADLLRERQILEWKKMRNSLAQVHVDTPLELLDEIDRLRAEKRELQGQVNLYAERAIHYAIEFSDWAVGAASDVEAAWVFVNQTRTALGIDE